MFLTWALGREVDPDANSVAFLAIAPAVVLSVLVGITGFFIIVFSAAFTSGCQS